jgi:hypothetical protein
LAVGLGFYRNEKPAYRGIGTHEKKIHSRLKQAVLANPSEEELVQLGFALHHNKIRNVLKDCVEAGEARFPRNPIFVFLRAEQIIMQRPKTFRPYDVGNMFRKVMHFVEGKSDEPSRIMREIIDARIKEFPQLERWLQPGFLEPLEFDEDIDDDDDDEDDGFW